MALVAYVLRTYLRGRGCLSEKDAADHCQGVKTDSEVLGGELGSIREGLEVMRVSEIAHDHLMIWGRLGYQGVLWRVSRDMSGWRYKIASAKRRKEKLIKPS